jgi:hypothetical protein
MSQIGPYLSQMGPKNASASRSDCRRTFPRAQLPLPERDLQMSRSKTYALVISLLASAALSTACTRTDATGPSDQTQASFDENQGANNKP